MTASPFRHRGGFEARDLANSSSAARFGRFGHEQLVLGRSSRARFLRRKYAAIARTTIKRMGGTKSKSIELSAFQAENRCTSPRALTVTDHPPDRKHELGDHCRNQRGTRRERRKIGIPKMNSFLPRNAIRMIQSGIVASNGTDDQASADATPWNRRARRASGNSVRRAMRRRTGESIPAGGPSTSAISRMTGSEELIAHADERFKLDRSSTPPIMASGTTRNAGFVSTIPRIVARGRVQMVKNARFLETGRFLKSHSPSSKTLHHQSLRPHRDSPLLLVLVNSRVRVSRQHSDQHDHNSNRAKPSPYSLS